VGAESYEGEKKALPWDSAEHRDMRESDPWERYIFLDTCPNGETKKSIGIYSSSR
jgi:hypothetical protein